MEDNQQGALDKKTAAVCGLYCQSCSLFIATKEDSARLEQMAKRFGYSVEEMTCHGCRSEKRGPYCHTMCKMFDCAAERGVDFCSQCDDFPCDNLKKFQSEAPHRIELWDDLAYIKGNGWKKWMEKVRARYTCPECKTLNSPYDLACRKCGCEPGSEYVSKHKEAIEIAIKNR